MADHPPQTYANHRRFVPGYHYVAFGILVVNLLWTLYRLVTDFSFDRVMGVLVAVALLLVLFYARIFPLSVQDRLIRLEMRFRLERLLPADLKPRIGELTRRQLVALRFASDDELPALTREVLDGKLGKPDEIKRRITRWEADHLRV